MNKKSFYELKIGQTIYYKGKAKRIKKLKQDFAYKYIMFDTEEFNRDWEEIYKYCSLELPDKYKRYEEAKLVKDGKLQKGKMAEIIEELRSGDGYSIADTVREYNLDELIADIVDGGIEIWVNIGRQKKVRKY